MAISPWAWAAAAAGGVFVFTRSRRPSTFPTRNQIFSTQFDSLFERHCKGIPVPYLRSLAKHESDFDPTDTEGCCWGLLQVAEVVREGFNRRFDTSFSRAQLLDPEINVRVACDLIARIARTLPRNHPQVLPPGPGGLIDFSNRRHVEIVTLAWNAGFSEAAGMGFVLGELERQGLPPSQLTVDVVRQTAEQTPKATRFLRSAAKVEFSKRVTRDFFRQL